MWESLIIERWGDVCAVRSRGSRGGCGTGYGTGRAGRSSSAAPSSLAVLLVAVTGTGYVMLRHFNANLQQADIRGLLGAQPVDTHPQAENILVIGSDSRQGLSKAYGSGLVTDQSDTMMIIHIPADRKWAEVMSIPRDSWVDIPACEMGNGQFSAPLPVQDQRLVRHRQPER